MMHYIMGYIHVGNINIIKIQTVVHRQGLISLWSHVRRTFTPLCHQDMCKLSVRRFVFSTWFPTKVRPCN